MDRRTVYLNQIPYETDVLETSQFGMEALGLFIRDVIGEAQQAAGFECVPTSPASMAVEVGPGRLYKFVALESSDWGDFDSNGGLPADTDPDHFIMKQAKIRDTTTFPITAPATVGHSRKDVIEAEFVEEDDAPTSTAFFNTSSPGTPRAENVSRRRRLKVNLYIITGVSGASPAIPATTAGRVPLWVVTSQQGDTTLTAPDIAEHPDAPFLAVSGGGGGGGSALPPWTVISGNYTVTAAHERLLIDASGGPLTITLRAGPSAGNQLDFKVNAATNNVTLARNGSTIEGAAENTVIDKDYVTGQLVYTGSTWKV